MNFLLLKLLALLAFHVMRAASLQLSRTNHQGRGYNSRTFALVNNQEKEQQQYAASVSAAILNGMRHRTCFDGDKLHLAQDLFDPSTGLHSEGVWHNSLAGIASLRLSQKDQAKQIADSLWKYSWDGTSFKRRAYSGLWDHNTLDVENAIEQPNYYRESSEHRCVQHGMALVFWSELILCDARYKEQQRLMAQTFRDEFWKDAVSRWSTVSASQGGGTALRPSASSAKTTLGATEATPYYRGVDQAVGVLACLAHIQTLQEKDPEYNDFMEIIQRTCSELMGSFGYGDEENVQTYIGLDRNRNFWHDGWVMLALICARQYVWPNDEMWGEVELCSLLEKLVKRYGHVDNRNEFDGTIWHWPASQKTADENVRYCGDNVLMYAITRCLGQAHFDLDQNQSGFWEFVAELTSREEDGLASVADVYTQVRLHPNTELAALLVWPSREE